MSNKVFDRAVDAIIAESSDSDKAATRRGANRLRTAGLVTFDALFLVATNRRWGRWTRIVAIRLLPRLNSRRALSALLATLNGERSETVLLEITKALATTHALRSTERIIVELRSQTSADRRYWLCYAIGCLAHPFAADALADVVADQRENTRVRSQAAEALGYVLCNADKRTKGYRKGVAVLIAALDDPGPDVRFWAVFALGSARAREAIAKLNIVAATDHDVCPGWWAVGAEASAAISVIEGGEWPERTPDRH